MNKNRSIITRRGAQALLTSREKDRSSAKIAASVSRSDTSVLRASVFGR
jgi:hypothetical protein